MNLCITEWSNKYREQYEAYNRPWRPFSQMIEFDMMYCLRNLALFLMP